MKRIILLITLAIALITGCQDNGKNGNKNQAAVAEEFTKLIGTDNVETVGAMVSDGQNLYISGNGKSNVFFAKLDPDGKIIWAKQWIAPLSAQAFNSINTTKTGGTSESLVYAGNALYGIFNLQETDANIYSVVIIKINPQDGSLIWAKKWRHSYPQGNKFSRHDNDLAYGLEVHNKYVFVTGTTGMNTGFIIALNAGNGELIYQKQFELNKLKRDRGFTVNINNDGELFITGLSGKTPFIIKINSSESRQPKLAWAKKLSTPFAAFINDLDFDSQNNIYLSFYLIGSTTRYVIGKIDEKENILWTKIFPAAISKYNNSYVIKYRNGYIYSAGTVTMPGLGTKQYDGIFIKMDAKNGKLVDWAMVRTEPEDGRIANHLIKGIAFVGDKPYVLGQICGNEINVGNFESQWHSQSNLINKDVEIKLNDWVEPVTLESFEDGGLQTPDGTYTDINLQVIDPKDKVASNPPDCDLFLTKFKNF